MISMRSSPENPMIALLASIVLSAFPIRGSVVRSLDSNLVIDVDTLHVYRMYTVGICPDPTYYISSRLDSLLALRNMEGGKLGDFTLAATSAKLIGWNGLVRICSTWTRISSSSNTPFRMTGKYWSWTVKADSIWKDARWTSGNSVRWSWIRNDSTIPTRYVAPVRRDFPQLGRQAYDLATGRRIALPRPMQTGRHLLDGPDGTRIIVVR